MCKIPDEKRNPADKYRITLTLSGVASEKKDANKSGYAP